MNARDQDHISRLNGEHESDETFVKKYIKKPPNLHSCRLGGHIYFIPFYPP
ncbi:hypothetical protein SAMN04487896_5875 [Paenibacillus sp. ov031]|nr:hypothetical protein SAMN04487896_5875 [Paenibacillus sp. ov031]